MERSISPCIATPSLFACETAAPPQKSNINLRDVVGDNQRRFTEIF